MTWRAWFQMRDRELRNEQMRARLEEGVGIGMTVIALFGSVTVAIHISRWSENALVQILALVVGALPLLGAAILVGNSMDRAGYFAMLRVEIASLVYAAGPDDKVDWTTELYDQLEAPSRQQR